MSLNRERKCVILLMQLRKCAHKYTVIQNETQKQECREKASRTGSFIRQYAPGLVSFCAIVSFRARVCVVVFRKSLERLT